MKREPRRRKLDVPAVVGHDVGAGDRSSQQRIFSFDQYVWA
jgi:hypothetical protein